MTRYCYVDWKDEKGKPAAVLTVLMEIINQTVTEYCCIPIGGFHFRWFPKDQVTLIQEEVKK